MRPHSTGVHLGVAAAAIVVIGVLAGCDGSSTSETTSAEKPSWDAALTNYVRKGIRKESIPGAIVGVWQDGKAPYTRAFGVRDRASGQPMATNLYWRIASVTKTFTVTAVLQLVGQGKVDLDDPIDKYVSGVPGGKSTTIRQLAGMRSGLPDYTEAVIPKLAAGQPERQWTRPQLLRLSFRNPRRFPPGKAFEYNNTNTVLLGLVVEKVSGQPLEAYIDEHILKPEKMEDTVFPTSAAFPSPHSQGYTNWTPQGFSKPPKGKLNATDWNPSWGWAAGAIISTLDDLKTWARTLGTGKLLTPAVKRERDRFLPAESEGRGAEYGLGLENQDGWIGHNGNVPGYMTYLYYLPSQRTTMVVMFNSNANVLGVVALMRGITKIITPNHLQPLPPKE